MDTRIEVTIMVKGVKYVVVQSGSRVHGETPVMVARDIKVAVSELQSR